MGRPVPLPLLLLLATAVFTCAWYGTAAFILAAIAFAYALSVYAASLAARAYTWSLAAATTFICGLGISASKK